MSIHSEIAEMEARREQLLDSMQADVDHLARQVHDMVSPGAIIQRHPILALAGTALAGVIFGRSAGAGKANNPSEATPGETPGAYVKRGSVHRVVDFAVRAGAVEMLTAIPWRRIPGIFKSWNSKTPQDSGRSSHDGPSATDKSPTSR